MKKNFPKALAVVLLTVIAILMLVIGTGGADNIIGSNNGGADAGGDNPAEDGSDNIPPVDDNTDDTDKDVNLNPASVLFPDGYFPKAAEKSGAYVFSNITAANYITKVGNVYATSESVFVIFTAVIAGGKNVVAVVSADHSGTLTAGRVISDNGELIASGLTSTGISTVINTENGSEAHLTAFNLLSDSSVTLPKINKAEVYSLNSGFLLFAERDKNTVYYTQNGESFREADIPSGNIKEIYDFGNHFILIINGLTGFSAITISDKFEKLSAETVEGKTAIKVVPYTDNGKQMYFSVETMNGCVYLSTYSSSFSLGAKDTVLLGKSAETYAFTNNKYVFVLTKNADSSRLSITDFDMNTINTKPGALAEVTSVSQGAAYPGGYRVLGKKEGALSFIDIRDDGTSSVKYLSVNASSAGFAGTPSGVIVAYSSGNTGVSIVGI